MIWPSDIPISIRRATYSGIPNAQVQIASARLPQIGTVARDADGNFIAGPIPGLGGPFDTAASFVRAWASRVAYPYDEEYIRRNVPPPLVDEIVRGVSGLPSRVAKLAAAGTYFTAEGPFPVRHADLYHSNIIVTKTFDVLGVIDWEGAHTVPWELVDAPRFLTTVPRRLNPPDMYREGRPLDKDEASRWEDREAYAEMVYQAELAANADHKLSGVLADSDAQDLAGTLHLFTEGKLGLYGQALEYFESKIS